MISLIFRAIANGIRAAFRCLWAAYDLCFGWILDALVPGARDAMSQPTEPDRTTEFEAEGLLEALKADSTRPIFGAWAFSDAATQTLDFCRSDDPWSCDLSRVPDRTRRVLTMLSDDERAIIGRAIYPDVDGWIHERYSSIPIAPVSDFLTIERAAEVYELRDRAWSALNPDGLIGYGDGVCEMLLN